MTTARETALSALEDLLAATFGDLKDGSGRFIRDPEKPPEDSKDGLVIMRDGDAPPPTITLSPVQYEWQHAVAVEISAVGPDRKLTVDGMCTDLDAALKVSRTLSGAVLDCRVMEAPIIDEIESDGTETIRAATITITLFYVSNSPIG
ncbi:MAG TPA: hypothetical protein DEQ40_16410 [Oxalobacteraceae bacterium]|jgi:hypothetical protein|nr:hypothetical protein [Oxalobacteraceae bacterium]